MHRIVFLLFVLMAGCSSWAEKERSVKLEDLMNGYTRTMEWSEFARALHYRKYTADRPPPDLKPYQHIKISEYKTGQTVMGPDKITAKRLVQLRYINQLRMSEHSLTTEEEWQYSEADNRWYLMSDLPVFPQK